MALYSAQQLFHMHVYKLSAYVTMYFNALIAYVCVHVSSE